MFQRILYIVRYSPLPLNAGGRFRHYGIWRVLQAHARVSLFVVGDDPGLQVRQELYRQGARVFPGRREPDKATRYKRYVGAVLQGEDVTAARFLSERRRARILEEASAFDPDLIVLGDTFLSPLITTLRQLAVPIVNDTHNVESLLSARIARNSRNPVKRVLGLLHSRYVRHVETTWLARADQIWSVSVEDARYYMNLFPGVTVKTVPNVVDVQRYRHIAKPASGALVFTGWYRHWPNQDAARRLIEMSGSLHGRGVAHKLYLVGRDMPQWLVEKASNEPSVEVTGEVPEVLPYLARATLVVAPISAASGSNLKLIEAMAAACPVLTTREGLEGIPAQPGTQILVADSDEEFLDKLHWYLENPQSLEQIGRNAQAWVSDNLSLEALGRILGPVLRELARENVHKAE